MIQLTNEQHAADQAFIESVRDLYDEAKRDRDADAAYLKQSLGGAVRSHRDRRVAADAAAAGPSGYERENAGVQR